jgi:hypothetical protein
LFEVGYAQLGFSSYGGEAGRIETNARLWNIGMTGGTAKMNIRGTGATSSTTALLIQNSSTTTTFIVRDDGLVIIPGATSLQGFTQIGAVQFYPVLDGGYTTSSTGRVLRVDTTFNSTVSSTYAYQFGAFSLETGTASNINGTSIFTSLAPTSGSKTFTTLNVISAINATGTYSGTVRGIYYNPTLTSMTGVTHRAIETTSGNVIFNGGNVGIGTSTPSASLHISGSSGSALLEIDSPVVNNILYVSGSGRVGIGTSTPTTTLDVSGSGNFTNNLTVTGSLTVVTGSTVEFQVNQTGVKIGNATTDSHTVTGSVSISSSFSTSGSALTVYKSGSSVLDIQGSQGQLFSVIDALSGSLMSVNDVSGLPILEVFSDDRVVMGTYGAPALVISGSNTVSSGSLRGRVVTVPTASGTASMDCSQSNFFSLTLSGSSTLFLSASNIQPGQTVNLRVIQPATSGSLTYGSQFKFAGGIPYSASSTGSAVDLISFISYDTAVLYGSAIKNLS